MIKNIVFDVGKVLVSFEPEQYLKDLGYDEITRKIVMSSIFKSPLWDENDSMLHLFGYDHMEEDERAVMEQKQKEILEQLQILR